MPRKKPRRNISRIDPAQSGRTEGAGDRGGWLVRIQRRGKQYSRFFADSTLGGNRAALVSAKAWRDALELTLEPHSVETLSQTPSIRNQSGTVGVRRARKATERNGYEFIYEVWVAQWIDGHGKRRTRSFSIEKYGNAEARKLAEDARLKGIRQARRTL